MPDLKRATRTEVARLPEDAGHRELVRGEITVLPSPTPQHQQVLGNLYEQVKSFIRQRKLGRVYFAPIEIILPSGDILIPDLAFVHTEHLEVIADDGLRGAPDWTVEILSPVSAKRDLKLKPVLYRELGVDTYWVVDPVREEILVWHGEDWSKASVHAVGETLKVHKLPGFALEVGVLFDES